MSEENLYIVSTQGVGETDMEGVVFREEHQALYAAGLIDIEDMPDHPSAIAENWREMWEEDGPFKIQSFKLPVVNRIGSMAVNDPHNP